MGTYTDFEASTRKLAMLESISYLLTNFLLHFVSAVETVIGMVEKLRSTVRRMWAHCISLMYVFM